MNNRPTNYNLLSPNKFMLVMDRFPATNWFSQRATIPGVSVGTTFVPTGAEVDYYQIGDKLVYEDFIMGMLVDEDLKVFEEILKWMQECVVGGVPVYSDMTLTVLTNNSQKNRQFLIKNAFPYSIGSVPMDTTSEEAAVLSTDVYFKYSHFQII